MTIEGKPRVLIIDDEADLRESLAMWLELVGCAVTVASSGEAALQLARQLPFDVALTDLRMPGLDGYATTRGLLALQPCLRVIVCTGYASDVDRRKLRESGASDCVLKPLDCDRLLHGILAATARSNGA